MKNIPTFEEFINEANSEYTLKDYYNNAKENGEEGLAKLLIDAAKMMGLTPIKIEVFTSDDGDDNFDKAEDAFYKAKDATPFNNKTFTKTTSYSKKTNIVRIEDESWLIVYLVQSGKL